MTTMPNGTGACRDGYTLAIISNDSIGQQIETPLEWILIRRVCGNAAVVTRHGVGRPAIPPATVSGRPDTIWISTAEILRICAYTQLGKLIYCAWVLYDGSISINNHFPHCSAMH